MEIFPYIFSVLLTALVIYWSGSKTARKPDNFIGRLLQYRDTIAAPPPARKPPVADGWPPVRRR